MTPSLLTDPGTSPEGLAETDPPLEDFILRTLAHLCRHEEIRITAQTDLVALRMDSLTLMAVATHVGILYGCEIRSDDMQDLFRCRAVSDMIETLRRIVAENRP